MVDYLRTGIVKLMANGLDIQEQTSREKLNDESIKSIILYDIRHSTTRLETY